MHGSPDFAATVTILSVLESASTLILEQSQGGTSFCGEARAANLDPC